MLDPARIPVPVSLRPRSVESAERSPHAWIIRGPVQESLRKLGQLNQHTLESLDAAKAHDPQFGESLILWTRPDAKSSVLPYGMDKMLPNTHELAQHSPAVHNVFLPTDKITRPNMRASVLKHTFNPDEDPNRLSFLVPHPQDPRQFQTLQANRNDFQPLSDLIDYEHPQAQQREYYKPSRWLSTMEPFVTEDELDLAPKQTQGPVTPIPSPITPGSTTATPTKQPRGKQTLTIPGSEQSPQRPVARPVAMPRGKGALSEMQQAKLIAAKKQIESTLTGHFDFNDPPFTDSWKKLGDIESRLGNPSGASSAYEHAMWSNPNPTIAKAWALSQGVKDPIKTINDVLSREKPSVIDTNRLAVATAALAATGRLGEIPPMALHSLHAFLAEYDKFLPIRTAWLAGSPLVAHDVLGMARLHDRLLSRSIEQVDVPDFIKSHDLSTLDDVKKHLDSLLSRENLGGKDATQAYSDLIYAVALAKQGRRPEAERIAQDAVSRLPATPVAQTLGHEFLNRVKLASGLINEMPSPIALPPGEANALSPDYIVKRLRQKSRTLSPVEITNAFNTGKNNIPDKTHDFVLREANTGRLSPQTMAQALQETSTKPTDLNAAENHGRVANSLMIAGGHLNDRYLLSQTMNKYVNTLKGLPRDQAIRSLERFLPNITYGLRRNGMKEDGQRMVTDLTNMLLQGQSVAQVESSLRSNEDKGYFMQAMSGLSSTALKLGDVKLGRELASSLDQYVVAQLKSAGTNKLDSFTQGLLTSHLEGILADPNRLEARRRAGELLDRIGNIPNEFTTTNQHFSLNHLELVDRLMNSLVTQAGEGQKNWVDQDEFDIRQRIHREMAEALRRSGLQSSEPGPSRPSGRVGPYGWRLRRRI